jgi:hypothetical protein
MSLKDTYVDHSSAAARGPPGIRTRRVAMARSSRAAAYTTLHAVRQANDEPWSVPRAAIFATGVSLLLWAMILAGVRSLVG